MLSFLIPTYNYNCIPLIRELYNQATDLKKQQNGRFCFEILVADDASPYPKNRDCYFEIVNWEGCCFIPLRKNMGRAKIRNYLAYLAKYDNIVFIDCDAQVCTTDFVLKYWASCQQGDVVCGSLRNPDKCPEGGELRYNYERSAAGKRTLAFRQSRPYAYFTTFNVMFKKSVFDQLKFDERCTEYGYEDALMGLMLEKAGYKVVHIDNPLIHNGIDQNEVYLDKVETSLRVLYRLGEPLHSASSLVRMDIRLRNWGFMPILRSVYQCLASRIRKNLLGKHPSLFLLKLYKLGYYDSLQSESSNR